MLAFSYRVVRPLVKSGASMAHSFISAGLALLLLTSSNATGARITKSPSLRSLEDSQSEQARSAATALEEFDFERIWSDQTYAETMLRHIDVMTPLVAADQEGAAAFTGMRGMILAALDRGDESKAAIRAVATSGAADPHPYVLAWAAASELPDPDLMLEVVEAIARDVDKEGRPAALVALAPEIIWPLIGHFREKKQEAQRYRLTEALVDMDWPGDTDIDARDSLRMDLVDRRLEQGNRSAAERLARTVTAPAAFLPLILMRKYDGLLDSPASSLDHFNRLLSDHDQQTASALADDPRNYMKVLTRAQFLRGQGREDEAASILAPFTSDVPGTHAHDERGMWLINEAAYALLALGRNEEALGPMSQLVKMDMAASPDLIGPSINYAEMLRRAGRPGESFAHAEQLAKQEAYANPYGRMWIKSAAACSLADLGRREEAIARLHAMEAGRDDNPAALMRAMLCLDELDAAEQLTLERLGSDEPKDMILALQDYRPGGANSGVDASLYQRLLKLRERPAVAGALDRVGRRLTLPLSRIYYGGL